MLSYGKEVSAYTGTTAGNQKAVGKRYDSKESSGQTESERRSADPSVAETRAKEVQGIPKQRGRKPAKTLAEYKYENKRLKMEVELLRDFLSLTGKE